MYMDFFHLYGIVVEGKEMARASCLYDNARRCK